MNEHAIPTLLAALYSIILGSVALLKNKKSPVNFSFFIFLTSTFLWQIGTTFTLLSTDPRMALFWTRIAFLGIAVIPVTTYHLISAFLSREHKKIILSGYIISVVVFIPLSWTSYLLNGVHRYFWGYWFKAGNLHPVFLGYFVFFMLLSFYKLYKHLRIEDVPLEKNRKKYLLIGLLIAYIGIVDFIPTYGVTFYPFGYIPFILCLTLFSYATARYRLIDIRFVFKKTAAYSLSAGLLTGLFVVLVLVMTNLFSIFASVSSFKVSIFSAILIALLFNPLRNRIQRGIDKLFYKKSYDFYDIIRTVSRTLASLFDIDKINDFVGDTVYATFGLKNIHILTMTGSGGGYETVYQAFRKAGSKNDDGHDVEKKGMLGRRSGIVKFFRESQEILVKDEMQDNTLYRGLDMSELIKKDMDLFHSEVVVPVFVDNKLNSMIVLGEKLSGDMFTSEDINLLNTIANQTAISITNAGLYKDKIDSDRLASIGMMAATFAHEIRNPLTSLKTFAQLMPEKYNDEEFRVTFSKIVEGEIDRIDGLIGDLLDFSQEKKATRLNNFNLVELVDGTVGYVEGKLEVEKRSIEVNKKFMEDEIYMSGDAEKLKQTFINILMNGCQAMNGEGELTVSIERNSKHVDVSIRDTGKGIPPEEIATIFDPFVTTKEMGVGLGLAISKRIIEDHMGKIQVKSKVSKGTTFTVSLPVQN